MCFYECYQDPLCNFIPTICYIAYPELAWELFEVQNVPSEKCIYFFLYFPLKNFSSMLSCMVFSVSNYISEIKNIEYSNIQHNLENTEKSLN